jgi:hypothetical protein
MSRPPEPEITWTLPLPQANMLLAIVGKQPFEQVADLIIELRNQATAQIQLYQQQLAQSGEAVAATQRGPDARVP